MKRLSMQRNKGAFTRGIKHTHFASSGRFSKVTAKRLVLRMTGLAASFNGDPGIPF
jgi:hypothetical protein